MGTEENDPDPESKPWMCTNPLDTILGLPDYGYRLTFSHKFKEPCSAFRRPKLHQLSPLLGNLAAGIRYTMKWLKISSAGKRMFIDNFNLCPWRPIYGVPVGGIGCGTIGRGFRGEFCRFQMIPGMYQYHTVKVNQFTVCIRKEGKTVYQQVLSSHTHKGRSLRAWKWGFPSDHGTYHALYPRSWTVYEIPEHHIRLICRQISPIIPDDYKDTSLPCAVFVWDIENTGDDPLDVSLMFTFKNGQGCSADRDGGVTTHPFSIVSEKDDSTEIGVQIKQHFNSMSCTYAIGTKQRAGVHASYKTAFNPQSSGRDIWEELKFTGNLQSNTPSDEESSGPTRRGQEVAVAVCAQCTVAGHSHSSVDFSLVWDMPLIHFGKKNRHNIDKPSYYRRYTRFFGTSGNAAGQILSYALNSFPEWESKIEAWQSPILKNRNLPAWYKSALFNELYYVSDGGTVWVDPVPSPGGQEEHGEPTSFLSEYSKFAYLEGHEYRMYNTYDVHHYASFALLMLWPKLQLSLQYDIAAAVPKEQGKRVQFCVKGTVGLSKVKNCVPHDIGDPDGEPWVNVNAYQIHPTSEWKDLNTKFVLQVYRDYVYTQDLQYLKDMYPHVKTVMENSLRWDVDEDGIIDNAGFADQTYDAWIVTGASSYCGGMWLAAVKMYTEMANVLDHSEDEKKFLEILDRGVKSFEDKLWNGEYYDYDSSDNEHHDSIMADQLAGHWFLKASRVPDNAVFPKDHIESACRAIFKHNIEPFSGGTMGPINGMRPDGRKDHTSIQSDEFWTGVAYGLGATMIQEDLTELGWQTAYGAYHTCYNRYGLGFQTPEAYTDDRHYRSLGYMRPLAIWSVQHALESYHKHLMI